MTLPKKSKSKFVYTSRDAEGKEIIHTEGYLDQEKCKARGCMLNTIIGVGHCPQHLEECMHLKIKPEKNYGLGLCAYDGTKVGNAVLFKAGDFIAPYDGEKVTPEILQKRYGRNVAPYGLTQLRFNGKNYTTMVDAAFRRSIGSIANHAGASQANARFAVRENEPCLVATRNIRNHTFIHVCYSLPFRFGKGPDGSTYHHTTINEAER